MDSVERVCSRIIVLHKGACVADGTSPELRSLMARDSLESVFAQLVQTEDPRRTARDIADVVVGGR
jgi:ABC-2 type transport system ATP-binding protein